MSLKFDQNKAFLGECPLNFDGNTGTVMRKSEIMMNFIEIATRPQVFLFFGGVLNMHDSKLEPTITCL